MITLDSIKKYLDEVYKANVEIIEITGIEIEKGSLKGYGYGKPIIIKYKIDGEIKKAVLETMKKDIFGHDYVSDRAQNLILAYKTFNKLSKHVKAISLGYFTKEKELYNIKDFDEFFILIEFIEGELYYKDLERIMKEEKVEDLDLKRCYELAKYLAEIHSQKHNEKELYIRRIRDLIGHGECIMGLIDSYPKDADYLEKDELKNIEKKLIEWRWKLKEFSHRLSIVHGDFHPWNVFFRKDTDFTVSDRSRGEYGEPADDVSAMTINYLFFSIQKWKNLYGPFKILWEKFFETYLNYTKDYEIFKVIQPFYVWRALVIANPIWYPNLSKETRRILFNFINNVLEEENFDHKNVNKYL